MIFLIIMFVFSTLAVMVFISEEEKKQTKLISFLSKLEERITKLEERK